MGRGQRRGRVQESWKGTLPCSTDLATSELVACVWCGVCVCMCLRVVCVCVSACGVCSMNVHLYYHPAHQVFTDEKSSVEGQNR